jgi:hypothetical protein
VCPYTHAMSHRVGNVNAVSANVWPGLLLFYWQRWSGGLEIVISHAVLLGSCLPTLIHLRYSDVASPQYEHARKCNLDPRISSDTGLASLSGARLAKSHDKESRNRPH